MKLITKSLSLLAGFTLTAHAALPIPNNAEADLVLGQVDFTSGLAADPPTASSLNSPASVVVDPITHKVFVCDRDNLRVLRYASAASLASGAEAEFAFGQLSLNTKIDFGSNSIKSRGMFIDPLGRLWLADWDNNRVLMFAAAGTRTDWFADKIFGQPNSTTLSPGTTAAKMDGPFDVFVDNSDRLWVADSKNNRVLRFDSISSKASGAPADGVLGQTNFTTNTAGSGSSGLQSPGGVTASSGGALYVTCYNSNRVLRFDSAAALGDGAGASAVLGQPDYAVITRGINAVKMDGPSGIGITAEDTLWVVDTANNRLLRFSNASTKVSGAAADGVLGQPDFNSNSFGISRSGSHYPRGKPFVDPENRLWVADRVNNRILRFTPPPSVSVPPAVDRTAPLLTVTAAPKSTKRAKVTLSGTASDASGIRLVQYRIGKGPLKLATGSTAWSLTTKLVKGKNTLTIAAADNAGNVSASQVLKIIRK
jgi:streptogramin lyase